MKKTLIIIMLFTVVAMLMGCSERRPDELQETLYTQEQVNHIVDMLLKEIVEIKYTNDPLDVSYDEATQTFTITEYNQHGEEFDIDIITINEIIEGILNHN